MKNLALLLLVLIVPILVYPQKKKVNHILIIDQTKSMLGDGDGKNHGNIWPRVQEALKGYCSNLKKGDLITIYTFDELTHGPEIIEIVDPASDIEVARQYIGSLQASGRKTGLKNALTSVLDRWDTVHYYNWMFIFTDGNDNISPNILFNDISERFGLIKDKIYDYGYLVTLGTNMTDFPRTGDIKVIKNPRNLRPTIDSIVRAKDSIANEILRRQHEQDSLMKAREKARLDSIERVRKCDSVTKFCATKEGEVYTDKEGNCHCDLPVPLWKKLIYILIGLVAICLIWLIWLKGMFFPSFERGEFQLPGNPAPQKFAGYKKIYLGSQSKVANHFLKTFFVGKDGHLLKEFDFSGEINLQKYKGKNWGVLKITSPDTSINQQGRMYNYNPDTGDGIYTVNRQGNDIVTFNYLNSQNQKQII